MTAHDELAPALPGRPPGRDGQLERLRRIEGQVRGLQKMVAADRYCIDTLTQVSAVTKALEAVALSLLDDHLHHCLTSSIEDPSRDLDGKVSEAAAAIARLVRS